MRAHPTCAPTACQLRGQCTFTQASPLSSSFLCALCVELFLRVEKKLNTENTEKRGENRRSPRPSLTQRLLKHSSQVNVNQMALVLGAAFVVVNQIGDVGNCIGGIGQALLNFTARTGE